MALNYLFDLRFKMISSVRSSLTYKFSTVFPVTYSVYDPPDCAHIHAPKWNESTKNKGTQVPLVYYYIPRALHCA